MLKRKKKSSEPVLTPTAETVLSRRYYLKDTEDNPIEDWKGLCLRVANAIAKEDEDIENRECLAKNFFKLIHQLDFLPNSPCLMNAGTSLGQLSACFVLPVGDSMEEIFTAVLQGALVHKTGGGTGYSFSRLRPKNARVHSTQGIASGPLSFINVFDAATETIKQGGKRKGANMGVLRVDHPDIMEFITAKSEPGKLPNFNLSVAVTDVFMESVKNNTDYNLIDPVSGSPLHSISAREVFRLIVQQAWYNGEPGVLYIDAANRANTTPQLGDFEATNPCGEQWLLPYESCNLGSINLARHVKDRAPDWEKLSQTTKIAVQFLDDVIDCNQFPIPEIKEMTQKTRKIGLGIMGLHDLLIQLELPYASKAGRNCAAEIMSFIRKEAEIASMELSDLKGVFPVFDPGKNPYTPRRNAALTSIQPTGTVSMIADCASGCEPYFSIVTMKHVLDGEKLLMVNKYFEEIARREGFYSEDLMQRVARTGTVIGHPEIPEHWQEVFRTSRDIRAEDHIRMQAVLQQNGVDSSISKTINLPHSASEEDVYEAYMLGHELGCKGLTVYRDGSRANQVLNLPGPEVREEPKIMISEMSEPVTKAILPEVVNARRYRLKDADGANIYLIVCFDDDENPIEIFAKFPFENRAHLKEKATMWITTCRLVSLALRCRVSIEEVIRQLERSSGQMFDLPAQLSKLLKSFMASTHHGFASACPECDGRMIFEEGCETCKDCGYSKCL